MSEEILTAAELADVKARLGMRQWTTSGANTSEVGPAPPVANWLPCVTLADVEWLVGEVERLEQECRAMRDRAAGCDLDMSKSPRVWRDLDRLE